MRTNKRPIQKPQRKSARETAASEKILPLPADPSAMTVPQMRAWLEENGAEWSVRDRKADLIDKIKSL